VRRTLLDDLEVLGIPCPRWRECLEDSREMRFEAWAVRWMKPCPRGMDKAVWAKTAHEVYDNGPLTVFKALHIN
jgi:hypothetical protein